MKKKQRLAGPPLPNRARHAPWSRGGARGSRYRTKAARSALCRGSCPSCSSRRCCVTSTAEDLVSLSRVNKECRRAVSNASKLARADHYDSAASDVESKLESVDPATVHPLFAGFALCAARDSARWLRRPGPKSPTTETFGALRVLPPASSKITSSGDAEILAKRGGEKHADFKVRP